MVTKNPLKNSQVQSIHYIIALDNEQKSLSRKLNGIWNFCVIEIQSTENNHEKEIINFYKSIGRHIKSSKNIKEPITKRLITEAVINRDSSSKFHIAKAYAETVIFMQHVYSQIEEIGETGSKDFESYITHIRDLSYPNKIEDIFFLNNVVPIYFNLFNSARQLHQLNNISRGIIRDQELRKIRSVRAATHRNYGQHILKDDFIYFFNNHEVKTLYNSIEAMISGLINPINEVLEKYQKIIGTTLGQDEPEINYGADLTPEGLIKIFHKWKKDPHFSSSLREICKIK